ncbi:MAG: hypothetical protein ABIG11_03080, partial [bacterium]
ELTAAYIKKHGVFPVLKTKKGKRHKAAAVYMLLPKFIRKIILKYSVMIRYFGLLSPISLILKKIKRKNKYPFSGIDQSLRRIMEGTPKNIRPDDIHTHILREGR